MDTISRENNSMLPVGGIVVGVIGLLLGGIALLQISKVNKTLAEHQAKVDLVDSVKGQAETAAAVAEKTAKELSGLTRSTQDAFNQVGGELGNLRGAITKFEEAAKKPVPVVADKKGGKSGPAVAGPGEYVVKASDGGTKIAKANGHDAKIIDQDVHVTGAADYSAQFNKSAFDAGIILESLTPIRPSLEDTFFEMTGD